MITKISYILLLVFICRVQSACNNITNEDKIDCVQHEAWTPESCVAKGCCYKKVTGFPSCYYSFGNKHEPRCAVTSGKRDCGNADTTEISCIKSGCCWDMKSGGPFCYHAVEVVTEGSTPSTVTEPPNTETTVSITDGTVSDVVTESIVTDSTDNPVTAGPDPGNGRGAKVAFVEVEAEHAHTNGKLIGNDRTYGILSSEASGRRAVTLDAVGQYVEFTMPIKANSVVVRHSIPTTSNGGRDASIDLYVDGKKLKAITFTSKYGWYCGGYPFNKCNGPGGSNPHHFYDEVRTMIDKTYPAGTKVKVQVSSLSESPTFTVDLADFELIGQPKPKPAGALSVVDFKADPTGKTDSTAAFQKAVDAGKSQKKVVYIPQGTYLLYDHVVVDQVTLVGAGPWHSVLTGRHPSNRHLACGVYGKWAKDGGSKDVHLKDFAIIGDIRERIDDDQVNGIGGALSNTVVDNLWIQHTKVGAWMDGPMDKFTIQNSRIVDTTADGVNFHMGVTNSVVKNTFLRNLGDDGLAMWAESKPNVNNKFIQNTIILPILANNIAIYGGNNIEVSDNMIRDTITNGGGIHFGNRYPGVQGETALKGNHTVFRNTLIRCGNDDFNWHSGIGAIWFWGEHGAIEANIHIKDTDIIDSSYSALMWTQGHTHGTVFENVFINGTGTFAIQMQDTGGELTFINTRAINVQQSIPMMGCIGQAMKFNLQGTKNSGWYAEKTFCGGNPKPKWPWYW